MNPIPASHAIEQQQQQLSARFILQQLERTQARIAATTSAPTPVVNLPVKSAEQMNTGIFET